MKALLWISHILLFGLGVSAIPLLRQVKNLQNTIFTTDIHGCETYVTEIDYIPKNSLIVIGHAYGAPNNELSTSLSRLVDSSVFNLLDSNSTNIGRTVFTGDVLAYPSVKLWQLFFSYFDSPDILDIAPGNHDVGVSDDNAFRDVFIAEYSKFKKIQKIQYPYHFLYQGHWFILDDSSRPDSTQKLFTYLLRNKQHYQGQDVYVLRHHIAPKSMSRFSNSLSSPDHLLENYDFSALKHSLNANSLVFIYGDSGAIKTLPRLSCQNLNNTLHIANGIGGLANDRILLFNNSQLYSYALRGHRSNDFTRKIN